MNRAYITLFSFLFALDTWAVGPRTRMNGVADYAQQTQTGAPDFLAVGVLAVFGLVMLALLGAAMKPEPVRVKRRR